MRGMRAWIGAAVASRRRVLYLLTLAMLFGFYSYGVIPKQEDPLIESPAARITVFYPGASPERVEEAVTRKLEEKAAEIDGYDFSQSISVDGASIVFVRLFHWADSEASWNQLGQKLDTLKRELPAEAGEIAMETDLVKTAGFMFAYTGASMETLHELAETLQTRLALTDGIEKVDMIGWREPVLEVTIRQDLLTGYGMSMENIQGALLARHLQIPSGRIDNGDSRIQVKTDVTLQEPEDLEDLVVRTSFGETPGAIRLGDFGRVALKSDPDEKQVYRNGEASILLAGYFREGGDILASGKAVQALVEAQRETLPEGVALESVHFQPDDVRASMRQFSMSLLQSVVLVLLVMLWGIGGRNALVVSVSIPISMGITLGAMRLLGIRIHSISIAAWVVALGMLVDNAIVAGDAMQKAVDEGKDVRRACVEGAASVSIPVLTSTITTVAAFFPLLLLDSMAGDYASALPQVVIIALIASYGTALFVIPVLGSLFFRKQAAGSRVLGLERRAEKVLAACIGSPRLLAAGLTVFVALAGFSGLSLGLQFFPHAEKRILHIDLKTERPGTVADTARIARSIENVLGRTPEVAEHTLVAGGGFPKFYTTLIPPNDLPDEAQFLVRLTEAGASDMEGVTDRLQKEIDRTLLGGEATVARLELAEPIGSPIRIRVVSETPSVLEADARTMERLLKSQAGVRHADSDRGPQSHVFKVRPDTVEAGMLGFTAVDIQKAVGFALSETRVGEADLGDRVLDILLKSDVGSKEALERVTVHSAATGRKVLLRNLADISLDWESPVILKYKGRPTVTLYGDLEPGASSVEVEEGIRKALETEEISSDVVFDGETAKIRENFGDIREKAVLALFLIYTVLLFQFKSFKQALLVFTALPFSAAGSLLALYLFRQPISFMALLGMVSLMGIVVNNAIILVDFINRERGAGESVRRACLKAVGRRFRPIFLTAITTMAGLAPLARSGGALFRPLALALMGGLFFSTGLTLILVPTVYDRMESRSD